MHQSNSFLFLGKTLVDTHRENNNKQNDEDHGEYDEDFSLV